LVYVFAIQLDGVVRNKRASGKCDNEQREKATRLNEGEKFTASRSKSGRIRVMGHGNEEMLCMNATGSLF
jgi:hypothetical protein